MNNLDSTGSLEIIPGSGVAESFEPRLDIFFALTTAASGVINLLLQDLLDIQPDESENLTGVTASDSKHVTPAKPWFTVLKSRSKRDPLQALRRHEQAPGHDFGADFERRPEVQEVEDACFIVLVIAMFVVTSARSDLG